MATIYSVRSRVDVDRVMTEMPDVRRVVVTGGGYIGLEAAAALSKLGKQVRLLEALDRVLERIAGPAPSRFFENERRAHGVDVRPNVVVKSILGEDKVVGLRLEDGEELAAARAIIGIGILPAVEPLRSRGQRRQRRCVDAQCRTSSRDVAAVVDCALHANRFARSQQVRLESVQNANDQAGVAAKTILDHDVEYAAVSCFWSTNMILNCQPSACRPAMTRR